MRPSPRRSVLASVAAGCCLAAAVVVGGWAAGGAFPFSTWPGSLFSSADGAEVALAPPQRADAPVITLPAGEREERGARGTTRVLPLDAAADTPAPTARPREAVVRTQRRAASSRPRARSRTPRAQDDMPDTRPQSTPISDPPPEAEAEAPAAAAASPAAQAGPSQPQAPTPPATTRRVKLGDATATFAGAGASTSGQPELRVQMAVADETQPAAQPRTVALNLKLAPTDVQALQRTAATMAASSIALETEVDVVDGTIVQNGRPACTDGTCLRVQMKFTPDERIAPDEQPEVQVLEGGDAISNKVKVVVRIDVEDLPRPPAPASPGRPGTAPAREPAAPEAGQPAVLSLPLPATTDPAAPPAPSTGSANVALPDDDPEPGAPEVKVEAQLEVVDEPPAAAQPAPDPAAGAEAPKGPKNCP